MEKVTLAHPSTTGVELFIAADARLQELLATWLLGCGGLKTRKAYAGDLREYCEFIANRQWQCASQQ